MKIIDNYTQIANILAENGAKRPFVCCGKSFQCTEVFAYLKQFNPVVFDHIRPNPRYEDMVDAAKLFVAEGCDFMIGAGGGSPMDSAKMIRLMATNDLSTCLTKQMKNNDIPSLLIPTTAGTGSEATKSSVFYINETEKLSISNTDFIPQYVLLDASLLKTLPEYQRKCTCLDALCHSIESYWNTKSTIESKDYAKKSIELFYQHKDGYIANTDEGNQGMLMSSFYGGKAINITGTTAPHAMCYSITMTCGTSHGHSVASGLIEIWRYMLEHNDEVNDERGRDYVMNVLHELDEMTGGLNSFEKLVKEEFALPTPKTDESSIPAFVGKVNVARLNNHPTKLTSADIEEIYKRILL